MYPKLHFIKDNKFIFIRADENSFNLTLNYVSNMCG